MVDWGGILAVGGFFSTCIVAFIAFGPIGRAIGARILRKGGIEASPELAAAVDELSERLSALQQQLSELAERQDFAERLLAQAREKGLSAGGAA